jgi:hypothetical protein
VLVVVVVGVIVEVVVEVVACVLAVATSSKYLAELDPGQAQTQLSTELA